MAINYLKYLPHMRRASLTSVLERLQSRSPASRWEAVVALASRSEGETVLRKLLRTERNEVVLAEICDAMVNRGVRGSIPQLRRLATSSSSSLVRSYAGMAVADLGGQDEVRFLRRLLAKDRSRRLQASILCALLALGQEDLLPKLRPLLRSRDATVVRSIATLLRDYRPRRGRKVLVDIIHEAVSRETRPVVQQELRETLESLRPKHRRAIAVNEVAM